MERERRKKGSFSPSRNNRPITVPQSSIPLLSLEKNWSLHSCGRGINIFIYPGESALLNWDVGLDNLSLCPGWPAAERPHSLGLAGPRRSENSELHGHYSQRALIYLIGVIMGWGGKGGQLGVIGDCGNIWGAQTTAGPSPEGAGVGVWGGIWGWVWSFGAGFGCLGLI